MHSPSPPPIQVAKQSNPNPVANKTLAAIIIAGCVGWFLGAVCVAAAFLVLGKATPIAQQQSTAQPTAKHSEETTKPQIKRIVGDETPLARIKADPKVFLDKQFVLTGGVKISEYYNYGYARRFGTEDTHYSLAFRELASEFPQRLGGRCNLYVKRTAASKEIIDKVIKGTTGAAEGDLELIRVRVTLASNRYDDESTSASELLEVLEAQFAIRDKPGWHEWIKIGK